MGAVSLDELVRTDLPEGQVEWALARVVQWSLRHDTQRLVVERSGVSITPAVAWALGRIVEAEPVRLSDLARRLGIDASTLTPKVQQLVASGLVRRTEDPSDRRAGRLEVTESGHHAFAALHAARRGLIGEALEELPGPDRQALASALTALVDRLEGRPSALDQ